MELLMFYYHATIFNFWHASESFPGSITILDYHMGTYLLISLFSLGADKLKHEIDSSYLHFC